ncbi:MAG: energy transducer TonB [Chitinophagaceae bacterium]|nr:energy transducer TonB [Chitinophagaceae bacterium]
MERNANGWWQLITALPEGTYTTVVQFVVDKEGNISDVRSLTNHGYGMEEEAMRVIKKVPNGMQPCKMAGRVKPTVNNLSPSRCRANKEYFHLIKILQLTLEDFLFLQVGQSNLFLVR